LAALRAEIGRTSQPGTFLPAYLRFRGNMYRHIPEDAWENRHKDVEVLIVSGLYGLLESRDSTVYYEHSMAEKTPPFGTLNYWWHEHGLPGILAAYLKATKPKTVIDLLSLEYRDAVKGFADGLSGMAVKTIDFPGTGRGSQPLRGAKVAALLKTGKT
jgi:cytoplasmic iron level regulating protein YaaA (DUF328/UPF0246 family)